MSASVTELRWRENERRILYLSGTLKNSHLSCEGIHCSQVLLQLLHLLSLYKLIA